MPSEPKHPMQPLVIDEQGIIRFKKNKIVCALLATGKLNMNDIAVLEFPLEDRIQFNQLIGYSVSGFGDIPDMPPEVVAEADRQAEALMPERKVKE